MLRMKTFFETVNRGFRVPALMLAVLLQMLPFVRTAAVVYESLTPAFAIILRLTAFSAATMGGLNAVSGATQIDQPPPPYQMRLTNGAAFFQPLHVSGQTAKYWTISAKPSWMNINGVNGSTVWSLSGTPTQTGVTTHTLTAFESQTVTDPERRMSVTLTVTVVSPGGATSPTITSPPTSRTVNAGAVTNLSVTATGTAPLVYQWRKGGINTGANSQNLTFNPVTVDHAGSYDVIVSNSSGSVTSSPPAVLTVVAPPVIQTPPADQTAYLGGSATFTVAASSSVPMTYQWRKGVANVGANSPTLTINPVTIDSAGSYDVIVSNQAGPTTSAPPAILTVVQAAAMQLNIPSGQPATGPRVVSWQALAGKSYTLQRRDNFSPDTWHDLGQTNVAVTGLVEMIDNTAGTANVRFYQLRTQ